MTLTKREKILLTIFLALVFGFVFYKFIFVKNNSKIDELQKELETKNAQYEEMVEKIKKKNYYSSEYKKSNFEVSKITTQFLPQIEQEKIIVFINKYLNKHNIKASSIGFSDVQMDFIEKDVIGNKEEEVYLLRDIKNKIENNETKQVTEPKDELGVESASVESITINVTFNAVYTDILEFIDSMQNNTINISITNINFVRNEDNTLQGVMVLKLYSVPKIHDHENVEWIWNDLTEFGRNNPFYNDGTNKSNIGTTKYDFAINIKPICSDLPTITLGKTNDMLTKSYVYADSNSIVNADLYFKEEDGNFYYKYNTETDSYPQDGQWEKFSPQNEFISIKIFSMPRNSDEDMSGIKINIINDTKYMIYINIIEDDTLNPRVYFEDISEVVISRN